MRFKLLFFVFIAVFFSDVSLLAQTVNVGNGSYTTQFPGQDEAGRNGFPSGTPFVTGEAATKPIPTNDWWSHKIKNEHSSNLFNYPFTLKTLNEGLVVSYIPWGVIDAALPVVVGVTNMNTSAVNISDFSDWTVTMDWATGNHHFKATTGNGMPFVYFEKNDADIAEITINEGNITIENEVIIIENAHNNADFAIYAPTGSVWTQNGNTFTSDLNGNNYWSLGFIPFSANNLTATVQEYQKYAYVFPTNTTVDWAYNENTSILSSNFTIAVDVKEGDNTEMLLGLLPHQWRNIIAEDANFTNHTYPTVRGEMKTLETNTFTVENTFHGILPTMPYIDYLSDGFSIVELNEKIDLIENNGLSTWTDSYNEGQMMNRLIQTARIAELSGDTVALQKMLSTIKERLEDWLSVDDNEVAFLFYYNADWTALLGYPAGHGQDNNINDHHFHWGYFIHAAAFVEQYEPGWAENWGGMIDLLVRDAASADRDDTLFPFLRNFNPYQGHCWANGFAFFPQGNDQESTSESMQFNSSLIHWGQITGNTEIRDLGIYLYTTEQTAIEEYWLDIYEENFKAEQEYALVSRVWGNSYDNGTFWTADIAASYGIEMYPIHGGSLYLGHDTNYVNLLWEEIEQNTGILNNEANPNLWHDVYWQYLAFIDAPRALELYNDYPERGLKFGISDAQTYHWLHSMNVLGQVDVSITANSPLAAVFNNNGDLTYVAQNYGNDTTIVAYSDGFELIVPPNTLATNKPLPLRATLSSSFLQAHANGSVQLSLDTHEITPEYVEFFDGENLIATLNEAPFMIDATNLEVGLHDFIARIYSGEQLGISNVVTVLVGEQLPYGGSPIQIPGSFDAGFYDIFEGGNGNGICYQDFSQNNEGGFRPEEYVDAQYFAAEGNTLGWVEAGEWLEYTVNVAESGYYNMDFRHACGNSAGGGPFQLESDGIIIADNISVNYTNGWANWQTKTVANIPLKSGEQILRIYFVGGELNIGEITFTYDTPLNYSQPIANAGEDQIIVLPENTGNLDASGSIEPNGNELTYLWSQVYGPSVLDFSDNTAVEPSIATLQNGVYLLKLTVSNGEYSDDDLVYIIASDTENIPPAVSISSPENETVFYVGDYITISTVSSDLNDDVVQMDLLIDGILVESITQAPFDFSWQALEEGTYEITVIAYDLFGASTTSSSVMVNFEPAPSCDGVSWNGDFSYVFSDDNVNPTLTFIPSASGVGSPTCILYYGTNQSNMPGYMVTPNVPFQLNAAEGEFIYFYYTYSFPGEVERNNANNKDTYLIGSCFSEDTENPSTSIDEISDMYSFYPNPVDDFLYMKTNTDFAVISVYDLAGELLSKYKTNTSELALDMTNYSAGLYLVTIQNNEEFDSFKIVKN